MEKTRESILPPERKMIWEFLSRFFYALFHAFYLFTLGIRAHKHRLLILSICEHFGYFRRIQKIPSISVADFLPAFKELTIHEPFGIYGNPTIEEVGILSEVIKRTRPQTLFEIGTLNGRTTLNLAAFSPDDAQVFTLDLRKEDLSDTKLPLYKSEEMYVDKSESGALFKGTPFSRKITQLYGDSAAYDYSALHNRVDFVFIDGAHTFDYVKSDTAKALELMKNGRGTIIWHDYLRVEGLTHALNEIHRDTPQLKGMKFIEGTTLVVWQNL